MLITRERMEELMQQKSSHELCTGLFKNPHNFKQFKGTLRI